MQLHGLFLSPRVRFARRFYAFPAGYGGILVRLLIRGPFPLNYSDKSRKTLFFRIGYQTECLLTFRGVSW